MDDLAGLDSSLHDDEMRGYVPTLAEETSICESEYSCPACIEKHGVAIGTMELMQLEVSADGRLLCACDSCQYEMRLLPIQNKTDERRET